MKQPKPNQDAPPVTSRWWPHQEALVYRLALGAGHIPFVPPLPGLRAVHLNPGAIERLFAKEIALKRRFLNFVRQGAVGVAIAHGHTWLSYAWMATPTGRQPYHLPNAMEGHAWIYYCHTKEPYRGRGLMGLAVRHLLAEAAGHAHPEATEVFCDVKADNVASRRAFVRLGFQPAGKVTTWRLPKSSLVMGHWEPTEAHDQATTSYPKTS